MYEALLVVFLIVAIGLVGLIMLQQGKGADMGASFGAGASGTLFGSNGSGNFMTRMTAVLATLFFIISLIRSNIVNALAATQRRSQCSTEVVKLVDTLP